MPNITIRIGKPVAPEQKDALQAAICDAMPTLPGKTRDNTVITIDDDLAMYSGGARIEGAFMDIRLYKASPEDAKAVFAGQMYAIFKSVLGIEGNRLSMNFLELEHWASGGGYR